jgi:D-alanine-D-alanine ligase
MSRSRRDATVVVLLGGISAEHDVSVRSGTAIVDALRAAGRRVQPVLVDLEGGWWWLPADHARAGRPPSAYDVPAALDAAGPFTSGVATGIIAAIDPAPVAFVALHGPAGEDGTVQGMLEVAGIAYTGSGVAASAIAMDKTLFKRLAEAAGLPVVPWLAVRREAWRSYPARVLEDLDALASRAGSARLIVKPARLGSSVGMTIAHERAERAAALETAFAHDTLAIVERCLDHPRELEVSVVGNDPETTEAFGPGEVTPGREFYDYAAKYLTDDARTTPATDLPDETAAEVRRLALAAYALIGAEGFARVDFLADGGRVYVSEVNTIPGFTEISLFPQVCAAAGIPLPDLCARIVALAEERRAARPATRLRPADLPR